MGIELPSPDISKKWLRSFVEYLSEVSDISPADLAKVLEFSSDIDLRLGQIAVLKGYLTPKDVMYVISSQTDVEDQDFLDLAGDKGLMSEEQKQEAKALQDDPFRLLMESLLLTNTINEDDLKKHMEAFLKQSNVTLRSDDEVGPETLMRRKTLLQGGLFEITPTKPKIGTVREILKKVKAVATIPSSVQKVLQTLDDPDGTADKIADAVSADPALTAQVLRIANSAFFGMRGKVKQIKQAVMTLGSRGVRKVVLSALVLKQFSEADREKVESIWWHSALSSQWARHVGRRKKLPEAEDANVSALIHDVGKVVMMLQFPGVEKDIERLVKDGTPLKTAEEAVLGITHADMGAFLCQFWGFPPEICEAILYHHAAPQVLGVLPGNKNLINLVNLSCTLADRNWSEGNTEWLKGVSYDFLVYHELDPAVLNELAPEVHGDAKAAAEGLS